MAASSLSEARLMMLSHRAMHLLYSVDAHAKTTSATVDSVRRLLRSAIAELEGTMNDSDAGVTLPLSFPGTPAGADPPVREGVAIRDVVNEQNALEMSTATSVPDPPLSQPVYEIIGSSVPTPTLGESHSHGMLCSLCDVSSPTFPTVGSGHALLENVILPEEPDRRFFSSAGEFWSLQYRSYPTAKKPAKGKGAGTGGPHPPTGFRTPPQLDSTRSMNEAPLLSDPTSVVEIVSVPQQNSNVVRPPLNLIIPPRPPNRDEKRPARVKDPGVRCRTAPASEEDAICSCQDEQGR